MNRAVAGCLTMISMMSSPLKLPVWPRNVFSSSSWSSGRYRKRQGSFPKGNEVTLSSSMVQPVNARAADWTSPSVKFSWPSMPTPRENNSSSSRPQFSLGASLWLKLLSSQKIIAGSLARPTRSSRKLPSPCSRNRSIWLSMVFSWRTLASPVANTPCQNRAIFSCSGRPPA